MNDTSAWSPRMFHLASIAVALLMSALILAGTAPWGAGVTPDSVQYLQAARSFGNGEGFGSFSAHWPPLYPIALTVADVMPGDVVAAARWVNAFSICASLFLLALLARRLGWAPLPIALFALGIAVQPGFLRVHLMAWSEPAFMPLLIADLIMLERLLSGDRRTRLWLALVACCAAAMLVRYAGLFLLATNAIVLLLHFSGTPRARLVRVTGLTAASLLPLLAWFGWNAARGVGATNRSLAWHLPDAGHFNTLQATAASWFGLPPLAALAILLGVLAFGLITLFRPGPAGDGRHAAARVIGAALVTYFVFIFCSITWVDHYSPLDIRILFPAFPLCWLLLFHFARGVSSAVVRSALFILLSLVLLRGAWYGSLEWRTSVADGQAMTSRHVQQMPVLAWLRTLPADLPIVSNGPDILGIYTDRPGSMLPKTYDPTSQIANPAAMQELDAMTQGPTIIVHFEAMAFRRYLPDTETLASLSDVQMIYRADDAVAWIRHANQQAR